MPVVPVDAHRHAEQALGLKHPRHHLLARAACEHPETQALHRVWHILACGHRAALGPRLFQRPLAIPFCSLPPVALIDTNRHRKRRPEIGPRHSHPFDRSGETEFAARRESKVLGAGARVMRGEIEAMLPLIDQEELHRPVGARVGAEDLRAGAAVEVAPVAPRHRHVRHPLLGEAGKEGEVYFPESIALAGVIHLDPPQRHSRRGLGQVHRNTDAQRPLLLPGVDALPGELQTLALLRGRFSGRAPRRRRVIYPQIRHVGATQHQTPYQCFLGRHEELAPRSMAEEAGGSQPLFWTGEAKAEAAAGDAHRLYRRDVPVTAPRQCILAHLQLVLLCQARADLLRRARRPQVDAGAQIGSRSPEGAHRLLDVVVVIAHAIVERNRAVEAQANGILIVGHHRPFREGKSFSGVGEHPGSPPAQRPKLLSLREICKKWSSLQAKSSSRSTRAETSTTGEEAR